MLLNKNMPKTNQKTIKDIHDAIVEFIVKQSSYESNTAIDTTIEKINKMTSLEDIFRIPIEDRLFNYITSLQWIHFIYYVINVINDELIILPPSFNISFSINDAFIYLTNVYNAVGESFHQEYFDLFNQED